VIIMTGCSLRYPSANGMIPTPTYGEGKSAEPDRESARDWADAVRRLPSPLTYTLGITRPLRYS
jgi:hypothetical protein